MSLRARREAVVREHLRGEQHGTDIGAAVAAFGHDRASYDVVPLRPLLGTAAGEVTHPTPEDVHAHLVDLTTGFPDLELVIERLHHADDAVIVEGVQRGTNTGIWNGAAPTGRRIEVRAAVFYRFEGDLMTNETVYFDMATMARQLGQGP